MSKNTRSAKALEVADRIKRPIVVVLLFTMLFLVAISTLQLMSVVVLGLWDVIASGTSVDLLTGEHALLLDIFGVFLSVFIAIELAESVEVYLKGSGFHIEAVLGVAIIAVARKVILLDYKAVEPLTIIGLGILVVALGISYYLMRRSDNLPAMKSG